jgi:hypothetical protein
MSKHLRGRVTFSNVVALLALFFALGGTVYAAGKLSGKEIKANSIPGNRVKKNSLTGKQIKDATLKAVGTAQGLSSVSYVSATTTEDPAATTPFTTTATCPTGFKAVGGGASVGDLINGAFISDSNFTTDRTGYTAHSFSGGVTDTVTVTAACVRAATSTG